MRSPDSDNSLTFQGQTVWIQAKQTTLWTKPQWAQWVSMVFNKAEQVKWRPVPCIELANYKLSLRGDS